MGLLSSWAGASWRDLRQASRTLRRRPGFVATALVSLALGIGANSAIFSVVDSVLLKPAPFARPELLVTLAESKDSNPSGSNPARLADWRAEVPAFQGAAAWYSENLVMPGSDGPQRVSALRTFGDIGTVTGAAPQMGRTFTAEEERGEGPAVAILSHGFWQRAFGGDAGVLGKVLTLSGAQYTVVGIWPAGLDYPEGADVWTPGPSDVQKAPRQAGFLGVVARLKPGVTLQEAQSQVQSATLHLRERYPATDGRLNAALSRFEDDGAKQARGPLLALLGAAGVVLLLACVNLVSLTLARASERGKEAAIRAALGAGRGSLIRLGLSESVLLAAVGGALGLLVALSGIDVLKALLPGELPRLAQAQVDLRVAGFSIALSMACALLIGLAPAWRASKASLLNGMKEGAAGAIVPAHGWFRGALVVLQVGVSVALIGGAGLLFQTFLRLKSTPLGFQTEQVLTVSAAQPWDTPKQELDRFQEAALERLRAIPGVRTAGFADRLPLHGGSQTRPVRLAGRSLPPDLDREPVGLRGFGGDYFQALRVPLMAGQWPARRDEVLVNETFARRYLEGRNPLGQMLNFDAKDPWLTISGVVGDLRQEASKAPMAEVFLPMRSVYWPMAQFVVRAQGDPAGLATAAREALLAADTNNVPGTVATMEEEVDRSVSGERVRAAMAGSFALLALLLACIGIYGLLADDVAARTREIGLRMALGAGPGDVLRGVARRGLSLTAAGLVLGLGGAWAVAGLIRSMLYGATPLDSAVLIVGALLTLCAAALACYLPARRAMSVDPVTALRNE